MNRLQIRERVEMHLGISPAGDGHLTSDRLNALIDDALSRISTEPPNKPYLLTSAAVSFASGTGIAALPTGFVQARELVISSKRARWAPLSDFLDPANRTDRFVWTIIGTNAQIDPVPTSTTAATMYYYRREPTLTNDAATPLMLEADHPAIVAFATHLGWMAKGDPTRAQTWYAEYEQAMKGMRDAPAQTSGPRQVVRARDTTWATWS